MPQIFAESYGPSRVPNCRLVPSRRCYILRMGLVLGVVLYAIEFVEWRLAVETSTLSRNSIVTGYRRRWVPRFLNAALVAVCGRSLAERVSISKGAVDGMPMWRL